jgi:orotidine-5'-phosphate decarboxylase
VGATYPSELKRVREIVGNMPLLIPGIGAQGGDVAATVKAGRDSRGWGMIISSSRDIIYASKGEDFAQAARKATLELSTQINTCNRS